MGIVVPGVGFGIWLLVLIQPGGLGPGPGATGDATHRARTFRASAMRCDAVTGLTSLEQPIELRYILPAIIGASPCGAQRCKRRRSRST